MRELVIADTSCLIVLKKTGRLQILKDIFQKIYITTEVENEFGETLPQWCEVLSPKDPHVTHALQSELDKGEASAIALCLERNGSLLLIDERKGRKVAKSLGLKFMGTIGLLIIARQRGFLESLEVEIERLRQADFRMSEKLIQSILDKYK